MSVAAHERIDLRTSPEIEELIVRAASTAGMSVSVFFLAITVCLTFLQYGRSRN